MNQSTRSRFGNKSGFLLNGLAPVRILNERVSFPYRHKVLTRRLTPHLQDVKNMLDVGMGDGRLARAVMDATDCAIIGIDVNFQPQAPLQVCQYDGGTLPFADRAFDCIIMVDMLHHITDIGRMLSEARRVTRHYVVIKDHYWDNAFDFAFLRWADYLGNATYDIELPYNFKSLEQWTQLFRNGGLKVISLKTFRFHLLDLGKHIVVKLERDD